MGFDLAWFPYECFAKTGRSGVGISDYTGYAHGDETQFDPRAPCGYQPVWTVHVQRLQQSGRLCSQDINLY